MAYEKSRLKRRSSPRNVFPCEILVSPRNNEAVTCNPIIKDKFFETLDNFALFFVLHHPRIIARDRNRRSASAVVASTPKNISPPPQRTAKSVALFHVLEQVQMVLAVECLAALRTAEHITKREVTVRRALG